MKPYQFQVLITKDDGKKEWLSVRSANGAPYSYETEQESRRMLEMCYPDAIKENVRVYAGRNSI